VAGKVERGREAYARSSWAAAYDALAEAETAEPLKAPDLVLLATAAYMLGQEDEWMRLLGDACGRYAESGDACRAARCAFWIGMQLAIRGQMGPATGWFGRAHRLLEAEGECVERAYLQMPVAFQRDGDSGEQILAARLVKATPFDRAGEILVMDRLAARVHDLNDRVAQGYFVQSPRVRAAADGSTGWPARAPHASTVRSDVARK